MTEILCNNPGYPNCTGKEDCEIKKEVDAIKGKKNLFEANIDLFTAGTGCELDTKRNNELLNGATPTTFEDKTFIPKPKKR